MQNAMWTGVMLKAGPFSTLCFWVYLADASRGEDMERILEEKKVVLSAGGSPSVLLTCFSFSSFSI